MAKIRYKKLEIGQTYLAGIWSNPKQFLEVTVLSKDDGIVTDKMSLREVDGKVVNSQNQRVTFQTLDDTKTISQTITEPESVPLIENTSRLHMDAPGNKISPKTRSCASMTPSKVGVYTLINPAGLTAEWIFDGLWKLFPISHGHDGFWMNKAGYRMK